MSDYERELGWDEEIENDDEFILLPEGDYEFEVISYERSRSKGSDSMPSCNMAVVSLRVTDGKSSTIVKDYILLHTLTEWKVSQFFRAIGQKKQGEKVRMNWNAVVGAKGRCKVIVGKYTNDKGESKENNKIGKYYDYIAPAPVSGGWQRGTF